MRSADVNSRPPVVAIKTAIAAGLIIALVLIGQKFSITLYGVGLVLILVVVVLSFTFNNVSEDRRWPSLFLPLVLTWVIVAAVFALAYVLAPVLTQIGG